jgi:hypothetical protein
VPGAFGGVIYSPEPDKQDDQFTDFPYLGNGITSAGLYTMLSVTRDVKQTTGETLNWRWTRRGGDDPMQLLVTDASVVELKEWDGSVVYDLPRSDYFHNVSKGYGIQYFAFHDSPRADKALSLELPPGKLECEVRAVWGKATDKVVEALNLTPEVGRGIWLEASLNAKSAWVPRAIDRSDWSPGKDVFNVLGYRSLTLKPGETQVIRVASPEPPRVNGGKTKKAK